MENIMKILVTYSSKTGNTKKLAEGIYNEIKSEEKVIKEIKEANEADFLEEFDIILVGYWVDKGGPNEEAKEFLQRLEGKRVGIFATLGFWPDSEHAWNSLVSGEQLVKDKNKVIGKYICQGKVDEKLLEMFKKMPEGNPHRPTPEKLKRYKVAQNHPSQIDIMSAAELFCERIEADV